ncbi:MAG: restriction endonuclease subunit S [Candidatus Dojkabacteria bacterium]
MSRKEEKLPEGWRMTTIGAHVKVGRGSSPRPIHKYISTSGIPWVKIADATTSNTRFIEQTKEFITEEGRSTTVNKGDLIVSNSATPGIPKIMNIEACVHDGWLTFRDFKDLDKYYLYYFFLFYRKKLEHSAFGTVFVNLQTATVKNTEFNLPPLPEQRAIADVLSSLDDKIELLREENKTLEELAQTVFKEWFVKFNFPNEEGNTTPPCGHPSRGGEFHPAASLQERGIGYKDAGGKMVESEMGMVPEGWRVGRLGEFIHEIIPGEWGKSERDNDYSQKVICLRGTDLPDIKFDSILRAPIRFIKTSKLIKSRLLKNDLIVEISGGTVGQSTGRVAYFITETSKRMKHECVVSNFCKILRLENPQLMPFIYFYWEYLYDVGLFFNYENGTTGIQNLNLKGFLDYNLIFPSDKLAIMYSEFGQKILIKIQKNNNEIQTLTQLRDTLLPKLMKGEVRVEG